MIRSEIMQTKVMTYIFYVCGVVGLDFKLFMYLNVAILLNVFSGSVKSLAVKELKFNIETLFFGLIAKCVLITVPLVLILFNKVMGVDGNFLPTLVLRLFAMAEIVSFFYNCRSIYERKNIKGRDYISLILQLTTDKLELLLKTLILKLKNK